MESTAEPSPLETPPCLFTAGAAFPGGVLACRLAFEEEVEAVREGLASGGRVRVVPTFGERYDATRLRVSESEHRPSSGREDRRP